MEYFREEIHNLFEAKEYRRLYSKCAAAVNEMLLIEDNLQELYVDIDGRDTLRTGISACNQHLDTAKYTILLQYEENYCAGEYFLSVEEKQP